MRGARRPLFLARDPYRRRRLRDAARLLPVAGLFLMTLPMLWSPAADGQRLLSGDVIWFFLSWAVLILVAAALAPGLVKADEVTPPLSLPPQSPSQAPAAGNDPAALAAAPGQAPNFAAPARDLG